MNRPETVACTRDFSHLFVRLEGDETCPHCYILELEAEYYELIMAVGNKYDGETRHETALRYIHGAEQGNGEGSVDAPLTTE